MFRVFASTLILLGLSITSEFSFAQDWGCMSGNCQNGKGMYLETHGNRYEGDFKYGKFNGKGTYYFGANSKRVGRRWEGEFVNGLFTKGTTYLADGSIDKQGIFDRNNKLVRAMVLKPSKQRAPQVIPQAANTLSEASLSLLNKLSFGGQQRGCVNGDCENGEGTYSWPDGRRYEGDFADALINGEGTLYYITGDHYEGDWVEGKRHGKGTYYFADGRRYEGDWVDNSINGEATFYLADGSIDRQGIWKDGKLVQAMALNETPKPVQQQAPQIAADTQPPEITMQRGINVVAKARHTVTGQAIDPSGVAIVEVNGKEASLDANGNFSANVLLVPGSNEITITAIDAFENTGYRTYSITREASAPAATPKATPQFTRTLTTGDYYALLIGVNEYESSTINDLVEPVKDKEKLGQVLVDNYSFDADNVSQLTNPTRDEILDELDRLAERLTQDDNLLIFYAGHGYWDESRQEGYWLPSDADQNRRRDWISNATVVSAINGIKTQHTLLVSDACFSGGIFKTRSAFNDIPPATEALYDLPSRKAMTSGTLTEVPDKSVFIEYLIKRLENNDNKYSTSQEIFASMRTAVINNSPTEQVPQFGEIRETGDEGGDFIFVRR